MMKYSYTFHGHHYVRNIRCSSFVSNPVHHDLKNTTSFRNHYCIRGVHFALSGAKERLSHRNLQLTVSAA